MIALLASAVLLLHPAGADVGREFACDEASIRAESILQGFMGDLLVRVLLINQQVLVLLSLSVLQFGVAAKLPAVYGHD